MIDALVVNGCSYMDSYAQGQGHHDLAQRLNLSHSASIAISGSANSRILRTAIKHSYGTKRPTFYLLGMTFLSRLEIPICEPENDFEGRWINPQNQEYCSRWQHGWTQQDSNQFVETKLKTEVYSVLDRTEDLMYRMMSVIADLKSRGHRVLMYQQADNLYLKLLDSPRLRWFQSREIVGGFAWRATEWQMQQGVPPKIYGPGTQFVPRDMTHAAVGHHHKLNEFLVDYIKQNEILS